jgi:dolichol-phosphate mannosyltransferase
MYKNKKIAISLPTYKSINQILNVLKDIPEFVDRVFVVDDKCPDKTGQFVLENKTKLNNQNSIEVLFNKENMGVGGATIRGYEEAIASGMDFVIKIDSDGQMDLKLIPVFLQAIIETQSDYVKGNRFFSVESLSQMPTVRLIGNAVLSFMSKLSSGYWKVFDPTNGFTVIRVSSLKMIDLDKVNKRFFFESDLLFRLGLASAYVVDVPMSSLYADEKSNISIPKIVPPFIYHHIKNFLKRLLYRYIIHDFNMGSLFLISGSSILGFGVLYGAYNWIHYYKINTFAPVGTIMIAAITIMMGFQLLLAFLLVDIGSNKSSTYLKKDLV